MISKLQILLFYMNYVGKVFKNAIKFYLGLGTTLYDLKG